MYIVIILFRLLHLHKQGYLSVPPVIPQLFLLVNDEPEYINE